MAISCPNKNTQEWKDLVDNVGEQQAYRQFVENDFNIPRSGSWNTINEPALNESLNEFFESAGITVKQVREITNRDGEVIGANAMADLVYKTIQVVEGKQQVDTLPEEASHFLVGMLRGSTLYNSMYSDIQNFDIYKEVVSSYGTQYKNDITKLKEEAMAKVIGSIIVGNFTDAKLERRANQWWNKVLKYIKELFTDSSRLDLESGIVEHAPFSTAADMIINNWGDREYYPSSSEDGFYQLDSQNQNTIVNAIDNNLDRGSISLEGDNYMVTRSNGDKVVVKNRVSDRVKAATKFFREFSEQEIANNSIRAANGTKGHSDIQNIINRQVALREGTILEGKTETLGNKMYGQLESYIQKFMDSFPAGVKFLAEKQVWDETQDEAGTLDLTVVYPDGRVDIYDWKFQEFKAKKGDKVIAAGKRKAWNTQLGRYAQILNKVYGVKDVRRRRVIPIEMVYDGNTLKSLKAGPVDLDDFTKSNDYLKPVPMISEMTGDERFDKLLEDLIREKEELEKKKPSNITDPAKRDAFIEQKKLKLAEIDRAIQDIQLTNDIESYVKRGIKQVKDIQNTGIGNLTEEELLEGYRNMRFYGQELIKSLGSIAKDKAKKYQSDLKDLSANAQIFEADLSNEIIRRTREEFGEDINSAQEGNGFWTRSMRTLSQQNHPILKAFYGLVQKSRKATRDELEKLRTEIEEATDTLRKYQSSKGIEASNTFDFMLDKTGRTLRLAAKYNPVFYEERNKQRDKLSNGTKAEQGNALVWFRNNTVFDEERYNKAYEENKRQSKKFFANYDNTEEAVKRASRDFENKYGDNATGYKNKDNFYVKPKDDFFSDNYKDIQATPEKKAFYDLYTTNTALYRQIVGQKNDPRFIWNIKKDFIDSVAENGLMSSNPLDFLNDAVRMQPGVRDGNVDPQTGEALLTIPTYYLEGVEAEKQSTDLGRSLYLAAAMAYNYKNMSEIEDTTKSLEIILRNSEEVLTNNNGEPLVNKVTGRLQKVIGSSDTIDQYKDYMNYYVYGVKNKTKDFKVNAFGKEFSALGAFNFVNKIFVSKALAANPVSIIANSVGGDWNVRILGAGKRFFDNKHYNTALKDLGIRDEKAYSVVSYLDLLDGDNHFAKANDLSVNSLTKHVTYENMFIGQKAGDYAIRNGVGLAMLKSHQLKDGKISRIPKGTEATSVYDMLSIQEGKLKGIDSIPEVELEKFRTKILKISEDILGNNSRDDIRTAGLTLMGRALLSFRGWIPRTVDSRYGELRYSEDIQAYELGRYRSLWNQIVTKQFGPLLLETAINFGSLGFADFGNATRQKAKELYREAIIKDPSITMTEDEYIDMHIANLRANMMEIYIVGTALALLMAVKPGDDDDKDGNYYALRKGISRQMARNMSELLFYYNPSEFNKMLKSPIPITRAFTDLYSLFYDSGKEVVGQVKGDEKMMYDARPMKYGLKIFPLLNGIESAISIIDEDYDRGDRQWVSTKGR